LGIFLLSDTPDAHLVFCATGTGIAPLRSMILTEAQKRNPRPITLLYGGRNRQDIAYLDEVESWAPNIDVHLGFSQETDPQKLGKKGKNVRITSFVENMDLTDKKYEFFICGNTRMIESMTELLHLKGIPENQIFMERFN
jgi:CDP-4-dehydro-6-deoxyglucose reductase